MAKEFWLSLPVKDVKRSRAFFTAMGFKFNEKNGNTDHSACLLVGDKNIVIMLFEEPMFKGFTNSEITDTQRSSEVLLSIDAQNKEEVDEMAKRAVAAGGTTNHQPKEMTGWMYGCVFSDIDGHKWNVLYMDVSKLGQ